MIEVFAGSARLSQAFKDKGWQTVAIDSKDAPGCRILKLNLLWPQSATLLFRLLERHKVIYVHIAPPCSTSSRAREMQSQPSDPAPLRSMQEPDGIKGLSFQRVSNANRLYRLCADIAITCHAKDIWWSIENPSSSLMWLTSPLLDLFRKVPDVHFATFHNCVYGGDRPKETTLWTSCQALSSLSVRCHPDMKHVHKPWGREADGSWSTSSEASYPKGLCKHWAHALHHSAVADGRLTEQKPSGLATAAAIEHGRCYLGLFPKASKFPLGVKNCFRREWIPAPEGFSLAQCAHGSRLPAPFRKGSVVEGYSLGSSGTVQDIYVAAPIEPQEFVARAITVRHPNSQLPDLPALLQDTTEWMATVTQWEIHKFRCQRLVSMLARARELQQDEQAFQAKAHESVRPFLAGKRLLLFQELLNSMNFPDSTLASDMRSGFKLTGWVRYTGARQPKLVPPLLSPEEVWQGRHSRNQAIWGQCGPSADPELDMVLWQITQEECQTGWCRLLPHSDQPPKDVVLGRRFAVRQSTKTRPIDDFSVSFVNSTYGAEEKILVMPSSATVSLALWMQRSAVAASQRGGVRGQLLGRTFDLKAAYKQLAIDHEDQPFSHVAVWNPVQRRKEILALSALPFGATASVAAFNRCSIALWAVAVQMLAIPWTVFFDDFTAITTASDSKSVEESVFSLFKVLGWKYANTGSKAAGFARLFQSLGVAFILPQELSDPVQVSNTDSRRQEVASTCLTALRSDCMSPAQCSSFAGRLRWLEGQLFGRIGRWAYRTILQAGQTAPAHKSKALSPALRRALEWVLCHVPKAPPRLVRQPTDAAWHVFTDGSFEEGQGGVGAVLVDPLGHIVSWFGEEISRTVVQAWLQSGTKHPVLQSELLGITIALNLWGPKLASQNVFVWTDSDAGRHSLIKGRSFPASNDALVRAVLQQEFNHNLALWFARVPTSCNPADAPSRGQIPIGASSAQRERVSGEVQARLAETAGP